ncbi:Protein kinase [Sorangium cellulosum So ce56]|uniref:Protein kinase n=1 Tax=Sorangium cellulosum (strain So ce56) TaxID=448385 RepID=A9GAN6_SORC5|nr:serine/threonine-protein kinase [Sorangium cellulosum]CAN92889.1 Protein kinase [Sorangium cellulosum So ce56]
MTLTDPFGWVGATLDGQFAVEAAVGEGGFGVVYRGVHLGLDVPVAIKCLQMQRGMPPSGQDGFLAMLRAEGKLLHQLSRQTANIVQALDIGASTSPRGVWTPYLVMEWLEGETLAAALSTRHAREFRPMDLDEAITLLSPAAEALAIAHENRVSHRDLKPANLFRVRFRGGTGLKVLDFGIAKVFEETTPFAAACAGTSGSQRVFTPVYAAPEQFVREYGATGPWTDVFAMALILIEVASGRRVLRGESIPELFASAIDAWRRPDLLSGIAAQHQGVAFVLRRALTAEPGARFLNMKEFWSSLVKARSTPAEVSLAATGRAPDQSDRPAGTAPMSQGRRGSSPPYAAQSSLPPPSAPASSSLPPSGENRVCTVLCVDLSSLAARSSHLDDEEIAELTDRSRDLVVKEIERTGGVITRSADERVIAVFGVPRATDNDAERAVVAALRVAAVRVSPTPRRAVPPTSLAASFGIATGRVFTRTSGDPQRPELLVTGEVVRVAAALQAAAPAGAIAVARDTYRQIAGRFNVVPLSPIDVPGRREPLSCYRVTGALHGHVSFARTDFLGLTTRLVGRGAETQRMLDALETMLSEGRAELLSLVGPPGAGRSRLLAELFAHLAAKPNKVLVLTAQCSPLTTDVTYSLAAALLRQRFRIRPRDGQRGIRRKLRFGLRWLHTHHAAAAPPPDDDRSIGYATGEELDVADIDAALLQVEALLGGTAGTVATCDSLEPEEAGVLVKQRIVAALTRLARLAARQLPIVVLCDDLQWADDASLDLLESLVEGMADLPLLLVCSARAELIERRPGFGVDAAAHHRQEVAPLARRHIEDMIKDRLRRVPGLSADVVRALADRAEGSPLVVEELLHLLVDAGAIEARGREAWVLHEERLGALRLPTTIQGIVQTRLDRLEPRVREVLMHAAVVGRTFWQGAVERLQQASTTFDTGVPVEAALGQLRQRRLIRAREPSTLQGEREMAFADAATHEVAYEMLSVKLRRALHLEVASWLDRQGETGIAVALLAAQYDRAGDAARAASAYARAAVRAMSFGENAEAIRHLERARTLQDHDEEAGGGDDAQERRSAAARERLRVRFDLGDALRRVGRLDDAERVYEEARALIRRGERRGSAREDRPEALSWDARIDARLALIAKVRGALPEARALAERAIARATEAGELRETLAMYALLTFLHRREGRREASWQAARTGLRICRTLRRNDERWREDVAATLLGVALALAARGRTVSAERTYHQVTRVVSDASHPHLVSLALNGVAVMRLRVGDLPGARQTFLRAIRLKERSGDLHQIAIGYSNLAETELAMKELTAARDHARRAVRIGEQSRAGSDLADMYRNLAEAELGTGDLGAALAAGQKALAIAETRGQVYLGDVAVTLARTIAQAAPSADEALRAAALDATAALDASLGAHFRDGELHQRAEACRALLDRAWGPRQKR